MIQFDEHIFQRGWFNHQNVIIDDKNLTSGHLRRFFSRFLDAARKSLAAWQAGGFLKFGSAPNRMIFLMLQTMGTHFSLHFLGVMIVITHISRD